MPSGHSFAADEIKVLDMVRITVELAGKGISALHCREIVHPRGGGVTDRFEILNTDEIQVGEQIHPALFVLPFPGGLPGVDRSSEIKEILHVVYARGISPDLRRHRFLFFASGYGQC